MSNIYSLEPRTRGHAVLSTTHGPVDLFLWSDECPNAVRNFVQHALNGYYDGLPFHRVLPGVLAQTGDPSRTGSGGVPAMGDPAGFPREQHGRLKFRRRGIAAMVADEEGKVRSQFFLSLSATPWLDGQHTIFGQVQGDSVFNLLSLAKTEVDGFEGDSLPRLKAIDIVENPFPDIVASPKVIPTKEPSKAKQNAVPTAKRAVKSSKLLSFQDDLDSDSDDENAGLPSSRPIRRGRRPLERPHTLEPATSNPKRDVSPSQRTGVEREEGTSKSMATPTSSTKPDNATIIRQAEEEFERIKAELLGSDKPAMCTTTGGTGAENDTPVTKRPCIEDEGINVAGKKRPRKPDESETLRRLKAFESRIVKSRRTSGANAAPSSGANAAPSSGANAAPSSGANAAPSTNNGMAAWFSRRLRLGTAAMEEEEYEVRFGPPSRANSKNKKR